MSAGKPKPPLATTVAIVTREGRRSLVFTSCASLTCAATYPFVSTPQTSTWWLGYAIAGATMAIPPVLLALTWRHALQLGAIEAMARPLGRLSNRRSRKLRLPAEAEGFTIVVLYLAIAMQVPTMVAAALYPLDVVPRAGILAMLATGPLCAVWPFLALPGKVRRVFKAQP